MYTNLSEYPQCDYTPVIAPSGYNFVISPAKYSKHIAYARNMEKI